LARKRAKGGVKVRRFLKEEDTAVRQPVVIGFPGLGLSHHLVGAHHCLGGKKPQQTELGKAAEADARLHVQLFEPCSGDVVVNVAAVGQGDPDVHVREKE
jgi:hypothetical protein